MTICLLVIVRRLPPRFFPAAFARCLALSLACNTLNFILLLHDACHRLPGADALLPLRCTLHAPPTRLAPAFRRLQRLRLTSTRLLSRAAATTAAQPASARTNTCWRSVVNGFSHKTHCAAAIPGRLPTMPTPPREHGVCAASIAPPVWTLSLYHGTGVARASRASQSNSPFLYAAYRTALRGSRAARARFCDWTHSAWNSPRTVACTTSRDICTRLRYGRNTTPRLQRVPSPRYEKTPLFPFSPTPRAWFYGLRWPPRRAERTTRAPVPAAYGAWTLATLP